MIANRGRSAGRDVPMDAGLTAGDVAGILTIREDNTEYIAGAVHRALAEALDEIGQRIQRRAQELCPVDTGRLRNSITYRLGGAGGHFGFPGAGESVGSGDLQISVGSDVPYATYVEEGTRYMAARPFLRPAAVSHTGEYREIVRRHLGGS